MSCIIYKYWGNGIKNPKGLPFFQFVCCSSMYSNSKHCVLKQRLFFLRLWISSLEETSLDNAETIRKWQILFLLERFDVP
jgi:hypothetical protein